MEDGLTLEDLRQALPLDMYKDLLEKAIREGRSVPAARANTRWAAQSPTPEPANSEGEFTEVSRKRGQKENLQNPIEVKKPAVTPSNIFDVLDVDL